MISYEETERLLTVGEVSKILNIHPNTLRRWTDEGKMVSYRIAQRGDRRFKLSDVNHFLAQFNHNGNVLPPGKTY